MNGENDKLIRDFMNAFEKKGVKVLEEFFHPNVVFRKYDHERHQYPCEHRSGRDRWHLKSYQHCDHL